MDDTTTTTTTMAWSLSQGMCEPTITEWVSRMRDTLKYNEQQMRKFVERAKSTNEDLHDKGECIAQAMLALRHIEDARMRLGKVIQYATTGESVYP